MTDAATFRDSTEIVLPCDSLTELREELETEFTITVFTAESNRCRIIGSPVEIKAVNDYLARHGVSVP
ncbi:MAG: hypothetical protein ACQETI_11930 [Halobacteriota archaeon]